MGRGIGYGYEHFMLYDEDAFYMRFEEEDEDADPEWDEEAFHSFKDFIAECFGTAHDNPKHYKYVDREAYIFADNDRLEIGIDSSGGGPCLFVQPKWYYPFGDSWRYNQKYYVIDREVARGFNKLIDSYGKDERGLSTMFRVPSSAWTSYPLTGYRRELLKRKRRTA